MTRLILSGGSRSRWTNWRGTAHVRPRRTTESRDRRPGSGTRKWSPPACRRTRPSRATAHLGTGPLGEHERHDAEDEGERSHQDRTQSQRPASSVASRRRAALLPRFCFANSTIRIAFLLAEPHQDDEADLGEEAHVQSPQTRTPKSEQRGTSARPGSPPAAASSSRTGRQAPGTRKRPPARRRVAVFARLKLHEGQLGPVEGHRAAQFATRRSLASTRSPRPELTSGRRCYR